ncbi:unnamed protein product [Lactuca virosa]|uniref:Replication protein A 70 kDa DNA-binding subunit B/D first OB fold domain-containing protein n=1 Tax=Lactuca virosa TaxID=75947 RepID=A0AAU9MUA4_9ASTR|nr:unnamed protein product [Lactuca virosa]
MNIGNKVYLKEIQQIVDDSHLKVRVLKMWNFIKNNMVLAIEMIVMGEEGTKYHSRVFNQNFSRFGDLLKEGQTYIILKINMAAVRNGFSVTGQKKTITLDWKGNEISICWFHRQYKTESTLSTQSVSLNEVPLESDDVVQNVQKDVISQTDESFTLSIVDKSSATSPMKISSDLKRNLHDIYDVDCGGDLSSTKSKRKSIGEGNPLLVPKVEK